MTARFNDAVREALHAAGWAPGRRVPAAALAGIHREIHGRAGVFGGRLRGHAAANRALAEFAGLAIGTGWDSPDQDGTDRAAADHEGTDRAGTDHDGTDHDGTDHEGTDRAGADQGGADQGGADQGGAELRRRPFLLDPSMAADSIETLIDVGRWLGTELYPLGVQGLHEAVLAITSLGAVLAIDPVGEWLLGADIDEALDTLITGRQPARAVPAAGPWPGRRGPAPEVAEPDELKTLGGLKRPVGAAFFLPRSPANLDYVWLPDTLTRLGLVARADDINPGQLVVEWGGLACAAYPLDLPDFTVLVLAFEQTGWLEQRTADTGPAADGTPLARAFRDACASLQPELDVAFVQTQRRYDLLRHVADQSFDVLTLDAAALVAGGLPLLYLSAPLAQGVEPLIGRDELAITGGRLMFAGTGPARW